MNAIYRQYFRMKDGDLVRFKTNIPPLVSWRLGLLVEYKKWEKIATVLHQGKLYRIRAEHVTKAGKKDFLDVKSQDDNL